MNEWMILSRNSIKWLNSQRKFRASPICSQQHRFHLSSLHWKLFESPFRSYILCLFSGYLRILRVTFPLIVVLSDREGSNWVLATLPFIQGLWPRSIQWVWENGEVTYKLLGYLRYSHLSPNWAWIYIRPTSFIRSILPSSRLT